MFRGCLIIQMTDFAKGISLAYRIERKPVAEKASSSTNLYGRYCSKTIKPRQTTFICIPPLSTASMASRSPRHPSSANGYFPVSSSYPQTSPGPLKKECKRVVTNTRRGTAYGPTFAPLNIGFRISLPSFESLLPLSLPQPVQFLAPDSDTRNAYVAVKLLYWVQERLVRRRQ